MSDRTKVEPEKVKSFFDNEIRLNGISRSNSPLVIFITGVSGSGKSTIIDKIDLNALKIQPDNYRKTHPKIDLFVEKFSIKMRRLH
ncbi:zeta toxin family protein [Gallibacterium anatis]|uniref:zeta toxin family protein n=1 Tax=Gallibacterium anatis TaxID=750 RepID=UPI0039FDC4EA